MNRIVLLAPLALAACGNPTQPTPAETTAATSPAPAVITPAPAASAAAPAPAATAKLERDYLGKWVGVEGMFLNVTQRTGGGVTLEMQWDLDHKGTFPGSVTAEGLRFTRDGTDEIAVPSDGDATGLKWLAGKKDCLTVKPGEGYCRG
ncbi:hypothetical protein [Sphingomonas adhaesiva]|uniref:hypothetical protein n=1 Tax=Sphingomonas adhaesiva TaxID=28212 RepID=UPI002FF64054